MALFTRKKDQGRGAGDEAGLEARDEAEAAEEPADDIDLPAELDQWREYDLSRQWRDDGPFDIDEVDLDGDEVKRVDLGTLIITPEKGLSIQMQSDPKTKQGLRLIVTSGPKSMMELLLLAAPANDDYCWKIRSDIAEASKQAKVLEYHKGPFGTEMRRVMPAKDAQGNEGVVPMRDWFVSGPRWVLDARLLGEVAMDTKKANKETQLLEEFFKNVVVRRGEAAMVPGALIPLSVPETL